MPKVLIASTREHPRAFGVDVPLLEAFQNLGADASIVAWQETAGVEADLVLVRSTWDYTRQIEAFKSWYQTEAHRVLNSQECFLWNYNKRYLSDLSRAAIPIVPTIFFKAHQEEYRNTPMLFTSTADRFCLKPAISAGSNRTFLLKRDDIESHVSHFAAGEDVLLQPYLETVEDDGEVSLMWVNRGSPQFTHAVIKRPQGGDFRVQPSFGGKEELFDPSEEHLNLCRRVLSRIPGRWVAARIDLLDWRSDAMVAEVEMIEPELFYRFAPRSAGLLAEAVLDLLPKRC